MRKNQDFREIQSAKQWWIWLIFAAVDLSLVYSCVSQLVLHKPVGTDPTDNVTLVIITIFVLLITVGFWFLRLDTFIDKTGVYVRFLPFQRKYKYFDWKSVESYTVRKYNPIIEFGGWGYRVRGRRKIAYNLYGKIGLELKFHDGGIVLIGTQQGEELNAYLEQINPIKVE